MKRTCMTCQVWGGWVLMGEEKWRCSLCVAADMMRGEYKGWVPEGVFISVGEVEYDEVSEQGV